ncbi:MAG: MaoC/PaaZ C-terminal domain-containing protein [Ornithinimicrobium sp.]|uniref:MaoC family dehydratase n=1 Tax=Ornithinimicrobium sp. TaxID=1977084 RepID=UPI0026DED9E7|nr:MaoC/PaaZ C-terminal domain-containing protein [Ornithinimicrobium sp.]MDO5739427.1 MaoC/PaaZ C-terminal domain-containing protein [Ornithinimicrobium sp.]
MTDPPITDRTVVPATADGPSADLDVRVLEHSPAIAPMFARALATGFGRPGAHGVLPTQRLMLTGVQQDVARVAAYCEVTGSVLSDRLPLTWLHVLTFPLQVKLMSGREFPFPMLGMVHVANTMTQHRPVRVAESLTLSTWVENLAPHRSGHTVDVVGEARVGDEVVWEGRSTYLVRGQTEEAKGGEAATGQTQAQRHAIPENELAIWRLSADLGRRYAKVSGDANPIHLSALSAKALGFPRAIAHGMWSHARVLAAVEPRLPDSLTVDAQFLKPILLPSTVVLRGGMEKGQGILALTSKDGSRRHLAMTVAAP